MNISPTQIKRALISVSDKTGIVEFARFLHSRAVEILSTGGTAKVLALAGIPAVEVSDFTKFPEIMDGRVKTLHPRIYGGILGRRDADADVAQKHGIEWIDLVVCNLYPFEKTIANPSCTEEQARDQIDIGGPSMIRSAAKNYEWTTVVVDPLDYTFVIDELSKDGISYETRKKLAIKAFAHTSLYDAAIANYFDKNLFPQNLPLGLQKQLDLRYGENPHQHAAYYSFENSKTAFPFTVHQGKQLSYNNFLDADAAVRTVREFDTPTCIIVKHGNPCGAASAPTVQEAYEKAYLGDPVSAFGGIVAFNGTVTKKCAEEIVKTFYEVILAPQYESDSFSIFEQKKNLRVLTASESVLQKRELRSALTGMLAQEPDTHAVARDSLQFVSEKKPNEQQIQDLLFAWKIVKNAKSNAIVLARDSMVIGLGSGHVSRIDSVECAVRKAGPKVKNTVLASDAFFPFRDSIDRIAKESITAIIQPGGSIRDQEVITSCNEHNIVMVFTGIRGFKH